MDAWRLFALLGSEGERDALFLQGGDDGFLVHNRFRVFLIYFVV